MGQVDGIGSWGEVGGKGPNSEKEMDRDPPTTSHFANTKRVSSNDITNWKRFECGVIWSCEWNCRSGAIFNRNLVALLIKLWVKGISSGELSRFLSLFLPPPANACPLSPLLSLLLHSYLSSSKLRDNQISISSSLMMSEVRSLTLHLVVNWLSFSLQLTRCPSGLWRNLNPHTESRHNSSQNGFIFFLS